MKTKLTYQAAKPESRNIKIALTVIKIFCVCYIIGMALASIFL